MEITRLLDSTQALGIILISYVLFFILFYGARYLRKSTEDKLKRYTFEFCEADKENYSEKFYKYDEHYFERDLQLELFDVLIRFEKIAIGVKNGILDEKIIKDYYATYFFIYYKMAKYKVLLEYRNKTNNPYAFLEFEKLSSKWFEGSDLGDRHVR